MAEDPNEWKSAANRMKAKQHIEDVRGHHWAILTNCSLLLPFSSPQMTASTQIYHSLDLEQDSLLDEIPVLCFQIVHHFVRNMGTHTSFLNLSLLKMIFLTLDQGTGILLAGAAHDLQHCL